MAPVGAVFVHTVQLHREARDASAVTSKRMAPQWQLPACLADVFGMVSMVFLLEAASSRQEGSLLPSCDSALSGTYGPHQSISCTRASFASLVRTMRRSSSTRTTGSGNASHAKNALFSKPATVSQKRCSPSGEAPDEEDHAPAAERGGSRASGSA